MKDVCKMYEIKMNNLLVDVEIFSLCSKETLSQAEFQQNLENLTVQEMQSSWLSNHQVQKAVRYHERKNQEIVQRMILYSPV